MDFLTSNEIKETISSLQGQLPPKVYEQVAVRLSKLVALLDRAHEDERKQLKAERAAVDKERESVTFARHAVEREREALTREREIIEQEKRVAQRWRELADGLAAAADALKPSQPSS